LSILIEIFGWLIVELTFLSTSLIDKIVKILSESFSLSMKILFAFLLFALISASYSCDSASIKCFFALHRYL
ncbi:hypothetical protein, partial [Francisella tularensis]|uniref:hypothetical protein n=1 Tax=Francisella tularensis TaxID=263 RepID=UPI001CD6C6AF